MNIRKMFTIALFVFLGGILSYGQQVSQEKAVINALNSFHQTIVENDVSKARELLSDSAQILESGNIETKEEYTGSTRAVLLLIIFSILTTRI